jgi:hypothetical protein
LIRLRSRKLKVFLLLLALSFVGWVYITFDRYREVRRFFNDPSDLAWASKYLDRKINFCDAPWQETIVIKDGKQENYFSPGHRFEIISNGKFNEDALLEVVDTSTASTAISVQVPFSSIFDFKWSKGERFFIFTTAIARDDWYPAEIFISDTSTGRTMYFGDSEFYECVLRHW